MTVQEHIRRTIRSAIPLVSDEAVEQSINDWMGHFQRMGFPPVDQLGMIQEYDAMLQVYRDQKIISMGAPKKDWGLK